MPRAKSKPRVYNLSWFSKPAGTEANPAPMPRHNTGTLSEQKQIGAVILYPALATPEILVGDSDKLEILLLTQQSYDVDKLRTRIENQLKISPGLDPAKGCADRALFVDSTGALVGTAQDRTIDIEAIPFTADQAITTLSTHFSCLVDKRPYKIYSDAGYKTLYRVAMSNKVLEAAMGSSALSARGEPQDQIINKLLDKRSPWAVQKDKNYYCFGTGGGDVDHTRFDMSNPVQSYHPVFHYGQNDLAYANLGHISDFHMAARQQVLAKSKARVIDSWDMGSDINLPDSPFIGDVINICSKDMVQILQKLGQSNADLLLIGGDLVDFLRSCYLSAAIAKEVGTGIPSRVWKAVELRDNYTDNYKDAADMIAFFGVLLAYSRTYSMPAYAVTGNHDCYLKPYGLSPRIDAKVAERRANEGIPSDHNLTFYEAILAFGETYRALKSGLSSPFEHDWFDWFYMVFTPFADFAVELPKQHLVAFGWGEYEDLLDTPGTGHGFGHLPRTKDAISDDQLAMLTTAIAKKKKVILMTHFTFVSYDYAIPVNQGDTLLGDVYISLIKDYNQYNFGTFERNRQELFETHCAKNRDIQVILTGHSHRRALYLVDRLDTSGKKSVKTRHFDFYSFNQAKSSYPKAISPAIIVSDSGGTIPRYNFDGEFKGRGSDPPSGTRVVFNPSTGDLTGIVAERADICRPRAVVGLDYLDIQEKKDVIVKFESDKFLIADEKTGKLTGITFEIQLDPDLDIRGFWIQSLSFFVKYSLMDPWWKIGLQRIAPQRFAITGARDVQRFSNLFVTNKSRGNFYSMKFGAPLNGDMPRYDFDSPWCREFQVKSETSGGGVFGSATHKLYQIKRHKKRAEIPDFDWRRTNMPGKYK
jgi:3',5'-cyclic AMP phosphodiesterase CpdA